ncbi:16S rRNA (cytosine(1402)-N(4))-methyltransferase RsmH [Phototrophicus methaneseepsis]|uniref:Ribosomal RNA small subunit methyltransferase H n=1 Tax=Phototrophicus methaneseepsis TaxID=2710758 RepID=A0A7S8E7Q6_9CHLR|nr:16S rRNA (cytosine(1402)-N(4))-methyltransferase RsmH [Phototrophicus methaneseepsis]QPC81933.1 16S rRNA (cytosine(1402)-N(4))-methyltransferase RsmH [Phototrophicus methaneseepsis]
MSHISVLRQETIDYLLPHGPVQRAIDGTLGAGGHTQALLDAGVETVLGLDLDVQAIGIAQDVLAPYGERAKIVQASYRTMKQQAALLGWQAVDAILLDLGVSSMQLDTAERGFAFRTDGPLDMRFTPNDGRPSAADIVNNWAADDLADIFRRYGEERYSGRIARAIVEQRPFTRTQQLAETVSRAMPRYDKSGIHPATRVFQALRIAVNDELRVLEETLPIAIDLLVPGGRLAVITFHSLEDRIVKQVFKEASTEIVAPPGMASIQEKAATVDLVTRKPIVPESAEVSENPRSRSSKLRVVQKRA